jgi:aminopeptidase-like protein
MGRDLISVEEIESYFDRLWPICRSITGNGLRQSLKIIQELVPLELHEVPTGTNVFDWTIPKEWNITEAYIVTPEGKRIADMHVNNLHIVNYSIPVNAEISFDELKKHLHYIEEMTDSIPYITSYYKETWGFCLSYNEFKKLNDQGIYKVVINSSLTEGSLTYGECVLKGEAEEEILFSTYLCHPSMANNELSGPLVQAFLYKKIAALPKRKYSYRFVFAPETIGVIAFLQKTGMYLKEKLLAGYVLTCCGDSGNFVYKQTKNPDSVTDKISHHVLKHQSIPYEVIPFSVGGSDERQYCSPGFNLPVGSLTRSMYQRYKEYHTSLDNKSFISFEAMKKTILVYFKFIEAFELNGIYTNTMPYCEPQLGKRGLYPSSVAPTDQRAALHRMMHLITWCDGSHDVLTIAEKRKESISEYKEILEKLEAQSVLIPIGRTGGKHDH